MKQFFNTLSMCFSRILLFVSILLFAFACGKNEIKDPAKEILSLDILKADSTAFNASDVSIILENDSIWVMVPPGSDVSQLKPVVTFKGKNITPISGKTTNFSGPVIFTVTAEDGTTRSYVVVVKAHEVNKVYVGDAGARFVCYEAKTGEERWIFRVSGGQGFGYSQATLKNNTVYVGGIDYRVYALNSLTGEVKWSFLTGQAVEGSPLVENGTVYIGSVDDNLYALDAETGKLKWSFKSYGNISGKPIWDNGRIYFASSDNCVYALDALTGKQIWRSYNPLYETFYVSGSPVLNKGTIYIGSRYGNLFAINASNGSLKWVFKEARFSMEYATPVIKNDTLFISSAFEIFSSPNKYGGLYAINANTGSLLWKAHMGIGFPHGPIYQDGKLFVSGYDDRLKAIRPNDGSIIWEVASFRGSMPTYGNDLLFLGDGLNRRFCAINPDYGYVIWQRTGGNFLFSKPLVVDNRGMVID